ncbi:MAG: hypothetical protein FE78DRAFT_505625 [Acidomyces sp. 'richmondensis']|nr:MAG: hypothetical protein FE78DRAFT_505625 [Acidomyces sp. 'richmondensis']
MLKMFLECTRTSKAFGLCSMEIPIYNSKYILDQSRLFGHFLLPFLRLYSRFSINPAHTHLANLKSEIGIFPKPRPEPQRRLSSRRTMTAHCASSK